MAVVRELVEEMQVATKIKEIFSTTPGKHEFEEEFRKELMACYRRASEANEAKDDRQVVVNLSQAKVWERLLKIVSGK